MHQIKYLILAVFASFIHFSCLDEGGFVSASDERNLRPLGEFVGKAVEGDPAFQGRALHLVHPKVVIQWRAVGLRDRITLSPQKAIDAVTPYKFSLSVVHPPPEEISSASEIAFGIISLFSDDNGNGTFDRLMHPDYAAEFAVIDSLSKDAADAQWDLMAISEIKVRRPVIERYYIDAPGILTTADMDVPDTVWSQKFNSDPKGWADYLAVRQRILGNRNRWEAFFARRKKDNEFYRRQYPAMGHSVGVEIRYDRALFPKPGHEVEFERRVRKVLFSKFAVNQASERFLYDAMVSGTMDYPFTGYNTPGKDWMAGRTIQDLLLYLPTQATLDTLLEAIPTGSFRISNLERLHPGYNLFRCDDQYNCDVRAPGDSILIYLGTSEAFFNQPPSPSRNPFKGGQATVTLPSADKFASMQGRYALNGSDTVSVAIRNGKLWCETTGMGLLRVLPMDSLGVMSPIMDFQGLFTPGLNANTPDRFVEYIHTYRIVTLSLGTPVRSDLWERIERLDGFKRADISDSILRRSSGFFDYNDDSLIVSSTGKDSLKVTIPGYLPTAFFPLNDSLFQSPWGELALEFQGFNGQYYNRVIFLNGSSKKVVPNFRVTPSYLVKSGPNPAGGMEWVSDQKGTGHDTYKGLNGRSRYTCSEDGAFLRPGDGFLAELGRTAADDSISLRKGGDYATFRFPGMKGKIAFLELRQCAEATMKSKRVRVSIWGGSDPATQHLLYGDHQWMGSDTGGIYWGFDSLSIDSDPYYLTLKEENTQDTPFSNAFDGYRLGVRP